jgi:hypothetical protein
MGFICHHFLAAAVVQTWVWSKDTMFGFSVPHREKLCAIVRVKLRACDDHLQLILGESYCVM